MTLAIVLLWFGCLVAFLGSKQQNLLATSLSKKITLPIFLVCLIGSGVLFSQVYTGVISGLVTLTFMMVMWLFIVFIKGHSSIKLIPFTIIGALASISLIQLGGL